MSAYGTYDRMARYSDFSEMEYTPEIASALDIYAEESVAADEHGKTLHIYSENSKIRLEILLIDPTVAFGFWLLFFRYFIISCVFEGEIPNLSLFINFEGSSLTSLT